MWAGISHAGGGILIFDAVLFNSLAMGIALFSLFLLSLRPLHSLLLWLVFARSGDLHFIWKHPGRMWRQEHASNSLVLCSLSGLLALSLWGVPAIANTHYEGMRVFGYFLSLFLFCVGVDVLFPPSYLITSKGIITKTPPLFYFLRGTAIYFISWKRVSGILREEDWFSVYTIEGVIKDPRSKRQGQRRYRKHLFPLPPDSDAAEEFIMDRTRMSRNVLREIY